MIESNLTKSIELHYYFSDDSHSMDAFIRNKCEHEILSVIREVSSFLGIKVKIETTPYKEGGLIEIFSLITENQFLVGILSGITINVLTEYLKPDSELDQLKKQKLQLEIKKLQNQLNEANQQNDIIDTKQASEVVATSNKIIKHKSTFYKLLANYYKVTGITLSRLNRNNQPIGALHTVKRENFEHFVLDSDELPPIKDEDANIEIISPVLKKGKYKYKWKGVYEKVNSPIDFLMKDKKYKKFIFKNGVSFKTGTFINCVLEIERKLSENGEEINTSYSVLVVKSTFDGKETVKTPQGQEYLNRKDAERRQLSLFTASEETLINS